MAETESVTEQLKNLSLDTLVNIKNKLVEFINQIITGIASDFSVQFVFLISIIIGIIIKRWQKWDWIPTIITILLVFMSLRYLGIG